MQYFFIIGGNQKGTGPVRIDGYGKGGDILPLNTSMQQFGKLQTSGPGKLSIMFDLQLAKIILVPPKHEIILVPPKHEIILVLSNQSNFFAIAFSKMKEQQLSLL